MSWIRQFVEWKFLCKFDIGEVSPADDSLDVEIIYTYPVKNSGSHIKKL